MPSSKAFANDPDELVLMVNDIDAYIRIEQDDAKGFLARYLKEIFEKANITPRWENIPWPKHLSTLRKSNGNICSVAVFKTKEREAYILYSEAIGKDTGFVLVASPGNGAYWRHKLFRDVVADTSLRPVLQKSTVFSSYINDLLSQRNFQKTTNSILRMLHAVLDEPNSYVILSDIRAAQVLRQHDFSDKLQIYDHYEDLVSDTPYFLACSKATDPAVMARINAQIERHGLAKPD